MFDATREHDIIAIVPTASAKIRQEPHTLERWEECRGHGVETINILSQHTFFWYSPSREHQLSGTPGSLTSSDRLALGPLTVGPGKRSTLRHAVRRLENSW
jgi:hypothetical protein